MNNLFVLINPLQLLTGYIIANSIHADDNNFLILYRPGGQEFWKQCISLQKMSSDKSTWDQVVYIRRWLNRTSRPSISSLKNEINNMRTILNGMGRIDRVFLGSDNKIQSQFMVELTGNSTYFRLEDGLWSYLERPDRSWGSQIGDRIRINLFRRIGNVKPILGYNFKGLCKGNTASADYLYKPFLLERPSPNAITIQRVDIQRVLQKLVQGVNQYPELSGQDVVLFLGSDMVEWHKVTINQELELLQKISELCRSSGLRLVFKPHPMEDIKKLKVYHEKLPNMEFFGSSDPIEFIYYIHNNLRIVMAHSSSGVLFTDLFGRGNITRFALANIYGKAQMDPVTKRIFQKAGVLIPNNIEEFVSGFYE